MTRTHPIIYQVAVSKMIESENHLKISCGMECLTIYVYCHTKIYKTVINLIIFKKNNKFIYQVHYITIYHEIKLVNTWYIPELI